MAKISEYLELFFVQGTEYLVSAFSGTNRKIKTNNAAFLVEHSRYPIHWCDFVGATSAQLAPFTSTGFAQLASEADHPGIYGSSGAIVMQASASLNFYNIFGGEVFECVFRLGSALGSDVAMGFRGDSAGTAATSDEISIVNDMGGGGKFLKGRCTASGGGISTATSFTPTDGVWYRAKIEINSTLTLVTFSIYDVNGVLLWSDTINSSIPSGIRFGLSPFRCASAAPNGADVDWIAYYQTRSFTR